MDSLFCSLNLLAGGQNLLGLSDLHDPGARTSDSLPGSARQASRVMFSEKNG